LRFRNTSFNNGIVESDTCSSITQTGHIASFCTGI